MSNPLCLRISPVAYTLTGDQLEVLASEYFGIIESLAAVGEPDDEVVIDFRTQDKWVMKEAVAQGCMPHQNRAAFLIALSAFEA